MSNVPELRFDEFTSTSSAQGGGDWVRQKLEDIGSLKNGLIKSIEDFGFGHPFVNLMDIFGNDVLINEKFDLVNANKSDLANYNLLTGDVLFIRSSVKKEGVGITSLILEDLVNTTYSGFIIRFRDEKSKLSLFYKKYCFSTRRFRIELMSVSTTSANTNVNQESLKALKLNLPTLPEQTKIATFITAVDTKIEQLTHKEQLLSEYKKGIMQKIFSQEIRFKDECGADYPDWVEKKLGDVTTKKSSNISANTLEHNEGIYKIYGASGFLKGISFFKEDKEYISIVKDGAGVGRIAMCDAKSSVLGTLDVVNNCEEMNLHFIYTLLMRVDFRKYVVGSTIPHIYYKDYSLEKVSIPSEDEQTKIANFLTNIDTKIDAVKKKLESTREFKKALLQQMFV
jgi:type I restriction enzyme S subunit